MNFVEKTQNLTSEFLPIYLEAMRIDTIINFDLFIKIGQDLILYRAAHLPFTEKTRAKLLDNNVDRLFVPGKEREQYQKYIESNIDNIINDEEIPEQVKAGIVYDSTKMLVKDVLANPTLGSNIQRSKAIVESSIDYIIKAPESFYNLLKVMSFDYYTYTHSVNVCTFSIAFARHLGIDDKTSLNYLGTGALLHDVGKAKVSDRILNKRSKLTSLEMDIIRKHPKWGMEIVQETNVVDDESIYPIIQHHEREDNSGYPFGISGGNIHLFGKIVGIADTFDAMTTQRVYQSAKATFPALKNMFSIPGWFDRKLLEKFAVLMGPTDIAKL